VLNITATDGFINPGEAKVRVIKLTKKYLPAGRQVGGRVKKKSG
jgi:hypothetical protein